MPHFAALKLSRCGDMFPRTNFRLNVLPRTHTFDFCEAVFMNSGAAVAGFDSLEETITVNELERLAKTFLRLWRCPSCGLRFAHLGGTPCCPACSARALS
jgi:hypothetical protein